MKHMIPMVRLSLLAALVVGIAEPALAQSDGSFSNPFRLMQRDGEAIYRSACQGCHMPDGQGAVGAGAYPALAKNAKLEQGGYPLLLVVNGQKAMPPFAALLDDDQVAAVVNYVRTHFGNDYKDAVSASDAKSVRR